jgi:hypothetical protein
MRAAVLAVALVGASTLPSYGQAIDIAGKWEVSVTSPQGSMPSAPLELKKDGDKWVGVFYTPQGNANVEATVKDKAVTILLEPYQTQDGPINISMSGTVDGDAMSGTMDIGGRMQLDWSARRAASAPEGKGDQKPAEQKPGEQKPGEPRPAETKVDLTGSWALEVNTMGGTGTPTVTLRQDGGKLSGTYTGRYGESAVTGTITGNEFTFSFMMGEEGNQAAIIYTGTADKDTMKGTVALGEMGEGTFTGKRK